MKKLFLLIGWLLLFFFFQENLHLFFCIGMWVEESSNEPRVSGLNPTPPQSVSSALGREHCAHI